MSLNLVATAEPCLNYLACNDPLVFGEIFNLGLCVLPRSFREELNVVEGFYYDISRDKYVLIALMNKTTFPSWRFTRFDFDPETGLEVSREDFGGGAIGFSWTRGYQASDWKKAYAQRIFAPFNAIVEVRPTLPEPTPTQLANPIVEDGDVDSKDMRFFALNRENTIIAFNNGTDSILERYDYATGTSIGPMKLPERQVLDVASESDELMWVLMEDEGGSGFAISKINFITKKYELYTKIPAATSGTDSGSVAFDVLRKSVAVFRKRADAADGSAQHVLDIYKPLTTTTILTAPVPVTELKPNSRITLVAHLTDDKGSSGGGKAVKVTKTNPDSNLKQPTTSVRGNGSIVIPYDTPDAEATDTITLQVTT